MEASVARRLVEPVEPGVRVQQTASLGESVAADADHDRRTATSAPEVLTPRHLSAEAPPRSAEGRFWRDRQDRAGPAARHPIERGEGVPEREEAKQESHNQ